MSGVRKISAMRRILVIHNPVAGRRAAGLLRQTLVALERYVPPPETRGTTRPRHATILAAEAAKSGRYDLVVVAGGDGTVREAIQGLLNAGGDLPLGIIPCGTANVLAHEAGLPFDAPGLARTLALGPVRCIHLGRAGGEIFTVMAGAGFDAAVVTGVNPGLKRMTGKGAYVWGTLVELVRGKSTLLQVRIDGAGEALPCASVIAANGHYYGGRFVCAPEARLGDASLEVVLFTRPGRVNVLRYMAAILTGRLARLGDVRIVTARKISVTLADGKTCDSVPVQADGDFISSISNGTGGFDIELAAETVGLVFPE